ncbi:hypothetical protein CTAYLR_008894 [Chrysophaeum taylorii]|uniref:catechol O-methyltransferase n=1 Tax=Chrysophaeum taylorii TaxID=2483200 RepID=A0AAD7XP88_9STRA|nr:hypothetical protein CTAYLR_008894 [Chrysophaeum taylorii]
MIPKWIPRAVSIVWSAGAVFGLFAGPPLLLKALVMVALLANVIIFVVSNSTRVGSLFWTLNTFVGWVVPSFFVMLDEVLRTAKPGDPDDVLAKIDKIGWAGNFMMNVGDVKGALVDNELKKYKPKVAVELGAHLGYSTVRFSRLLERGTKLYSVDPEPIGHAVKAALVAFAGLQDRVVPVYDYSDKFMHAMADRNEKIDFLFIDHVKEIYLKDLQLALSLGLLKPGAVVMADNVLFPGAPDYKEFVLLDPRFETTVHSTFVEYSTTTKDEVLVSIYKGE